MCLPDFEKFDIFSEDNSLIGYRIWRLLLKDTSKLLSDNRDYKWDKVIEGPHEVLDNNSGIYAYNYYNYNNYYYNYNYYNYNNYYYNYNNYNNNYYNYNYNNNYNNYYNYYYNYNYNNYYYNISGIINQYGRVAIHKDGQRSEFARITALFTIRESDAKGPKEFLNWIHKFNLIIEELAKKYECNTIHWQDFIDAANV